MIFLRIYNLNKPIYLFGVLRKGKKAITTRIASFAIMVLIVYGLTFHYFWAFVLYLVDYLIGLSHTLIVLIKKPKISYDIYFEGLFKSHKKLIPFIKIGGIILWLLITIYLFKIFI
jgi:hypothetical protein